MSQFYLQIYHNFCRNTAKCTRTIMGQTHEESESMPGAEKMGATKAGGGKLQGGRNSPNVPEDVENRF